MHSPAAAEELSAVAGICGVIVEGATSSSSLFRPNCPVIAVDSSNDAGLSDIQLEDGMSLDKLKTTIEQSPIASATLVQLSRNNHHASVFDALFAESLAYSTLQHSEPFLSWLASEKPTNIKHFVGPAIIAERQANQLVLVLNRPENRNAWSTDMRDALAEQLQLACADDTIKGITLKANGPAFGAGGDLTEFGAARDAGIAHVSRQTRSPAQLMHILRDKITVMLHGACVGAGIELPAFATSIVAQPKAFFQLPEVQFGLIPGAGGSASILKRIGRSRFNYMALSGERISAQVALKWRLIDKLIDANDV
ncbi:MAG: enoyl-CoA hydratase/isomerase family protein [Gammaproteobacteria bacterium]|nr:enoyl-CoA hydratase/isomerase family protein [Gammaproteobacteria bacterium]